MKTLEAPIPPAQPRARASRERCVARQARGLPEVVRAFAAARFSLEGVTRVSVPSPAFVARDHEDNQDMARLIRGDFAAMGNIMERHTKRLLRYLVHILRDRTEAADQVQEAFIRVFRHRQSFNFKNRFSTWLYAIATNLARDCLRRWGRRPGLLARLHGCETDPVDWAELLVDSAPRPDQELEMKERFLTLEEAQAALPAHLRVPIRLQAYEGQSHAEIAAALNCSVKAVEMRLHHARIRLRSELKRKLKYENYRHTTTCWSNA